MLNGKSGEELFAELMRKRGYEVEDVSDDPRYWYKDIDFIVSSPFASATVEVKWDARIHKTGNLYLEIANAHSGGTGWYEFCKADYVAYGDAVNRKFYLFSLAELRAIESKRRKEYAECGSDSIGLLMPLSAIKNIIIDVLQED